MKKIILLLLCFNFTNVLFAQLQTYTDLNEFENEYNSVLNQEDFSGGPSDPSICGTVVSSAGNDCFPAGELIEGFELTESENAEIVFLPEGFLPSNNPTPRLGANIGADFTVISFTGPDDVYAVGISIHIDDNADFNYRAFDSSNNVIYNALIPFSSFYGIISDTPIARIEIEGIGGIGELLGDLKFGTENVLGNGEFEHTKVSYYPNPVKNILNITSSLETSHIDLFNLIGQKVESFVQGTKTLDIQHLETGIYLLKIAFENGQRETLKIVKE